MNKSYITTIEKPDERYHRSHVILHEDYQWHFGDFNTMEQLQCLADTLGFTFKMVEESKTFLGKPNIYRRYEMSHAIVNSNYQFWKIKDIPSNAKPFKALSNGSIVTCYFTNDGETITIYRPNPNATKENKDRYKTKFEYDVAVAKRIYYPNSLEFDAVYDPMTLSEHIAYQKKYGSY